MKRRDEGRKEVVEVEEVKEAEAGMREDQHEGKLMGIDGKTDINLMCCGAKKNVCRR